MEILDPMLIVCLVFIILRKCPFISSYLSVFFLSSKVASFCQMFSLHQLRWSCGFFSLYSVNVGNYTDCFLYTEPFFCCRNRLHLAMVYTPIEFKKWSWNPKLIYWLLYLSMSIFLTRDFYIFISFTLVSSILSFQPKGLSSAFLRA